MEEIAMNEMHDKSGRRNYLVPIQMWIPLVITLTANAIAYYGSRLITTHRVHVDLTNPLDDRIPLVPWTVSIYFGCYLLWIANYIIAYRMEEKKAYRFASADLFAKMICLAFFVLLPTTNVRPEIVGDSFWEAAMRLLYQMDAADNLLPSIHCLTSWFCFIAVRENDKIPTWYRVFTLVFALLVCVSTLTTKQHVLIDVVCGVALAELCYWLVNVSHFADWYACRMRQCNNWLRRTFRYSE